MKNKKTLYYSLFIIITLLFVHLYMRVYVIMLNKWPFPHSGVMSTLTLFSFEHFIALLFNVIMGMLLGTEHIIKNIKIRGKWEIDIKKFFIIGIPSLLLSVEAIHFFLLNNILNKIGMSVFYLIAPAREPFFRILFGYTFITSLYKEEI